MITNPKMKDYNFLKDMYRDDYFPDVLVDKGKAILVALCEKIESSKPDNADALFVLTHAATEAFNDLQEDFWEHDSEIETAAREAIAEDFGYIVEAYGFDVDIEDVIAPRDW